MKTTEISWLAGTFSKTLLFYFPSMPKLLQGLLIIGLASLLITGFFALLSFFISPPNAS